MSSRRWTWPAIPARGEVEAISKQDVADQLKERGLVVVDIAAQVPLQGAQPRAVFAGQAEGPSGRVEAARDDGLIGDDDSSRAVRSREPDRVEDARRNGRRRSARTSRRGCCSPTRSSATRRCSGLSTSRWSGGGDRRCARGVPAAHGRPAREGRLAAPADPLGDDLPGAGDHVSRLSCCSRSVAFLIPVFENVLQAIPGQAAGAEPVHGRLLAPLTKQWYLLFVFVVVPSCSSFLRKRSKWGRPPGMASSSGSR